MRRFVLPPLVALSLTSILIPTPAEEPRPAEDEASDQTDDAKTDDELFTQRVVVTSRMPELPAVEQIKPDLLREGSTTDIAEAFREQPGLASFRRGPINLDPCIRGLQETEVGMFVDGTRTFAAGPGRMDSELSHVSLYSIDRVRVVKGPYALTWGAGTMSAIQLDTQRAEFSNGELQLSGAVGANYAVNTVAPETYANVGGGAKRYRFQVFASARRGDDYEDGNGVTVPASYESGDTRWSVGGKPTDSTLLEYSGGYQRQEDIDYPGRILDATFFKTTSHALDFRWTPSEAGFELHAQVYSNFKEHLMNNDNKPTAAQIDVELPAQSDTVGGRLYGVLHGGALEWRLGTDYYRLDQKAVRTIRSRSSGDELFGGPSIVWPDSVIQDLGVYAQLLYPRGRTLFGATVRYDRVDVDAGQVSQDFIDATTGDLDQTEDNFSVALSAELGFGERWRMNVGVGQATRTANALERYSNFFPSTKFQVSAEFVGDPEIKPERATELNLGATGNYDKLQVQIDLFARNIDDYIDVMPDPGLTPVLPISFPVVYRYIVGEQARFVGGEARLQQVISGGWQWRLSAMYRWAEDTLFDEPVIGIPPLMGEVGLRYRSQGDRRWWVDLGVWLVDAQDRVAEARFEMPTPGYSVVHLRGQVEVVDGLEVRAGIDNLLDRGYANHLNSPDPFTGERIQEVGRNAYLGLRYRF